MSTAEDHALTRLTTARPAELVAALGPHLNAGVSASLVAVPDERPASTTADLVPPRAPVAAGPDDPWAALAPEPDPWDVFVDDPGPGVPPLLRAARAVDARHGDAGREPPVGARDRQHGRRTAPRVRPAARDGAAPPCRPAVPVDAAVWLLVADRIPEVARRRRQPGRRRRDDRAVLEGILHVLATGIGWRELPQALGCGSGVTCWRRLREWVDGGVWAEVESALRSALGPGSGVDWDRAWGADGRPGATVVERVVPRAEAGRDPGATATAMLRRRGWAGPSLT